MAVCWPPATRSTVWVFGSLPACEPVEIFEASHSIETLAFHPTESLEAAGLGSGEILLWQPNSKKPQAATSAHPRGVRALTWRPNGATLVSRGLGQHRAVFSHVHSGHPATPLTTPVPVTGLAYRPDGASWPGEVPGPFTHCPKRSGPDKRLAASMACSPWR